MRTTITLSCDPGVDPLVDHGSGATDTKISMRRRFDDLARVINATGSGTRPGITTIRYGKRPAFGTLSLSGGSGAVGGNINGVTVTATWATSDINSAGLVAAAINASSDALVANLVQASNYSGTVTLATCTAGTILDITGVRFKAMASVASSPVFGEFSIAGNDTADAVALAEAINVHPQLRDRVRATSALGVVTVMSIPAVPVNKNITVISGSGVTTTGILALSVIVHVSALNLGTVGNCITLVASGTGVTASGARLTNGTVGVVAL